MIGQSNQNKMVLITLSSVFTVCVLAIFISFSYNATASVSTSFVGVQVGGGTPTNPLFAYIPQKVEIKVGDSVVWNAPSSAPQEPHTVTFVLGNNTMTTFDTPFAVPISTNFMSLPTGANSQPNIIPGKNGMNIIVANNARAYSPTIIDFTGKVRMALPNTIFTFMGDEKYVNLGVLAPKGSPYPGSSDTFSLTFQKAGTFNYLCILHPWMSGQVVVK
jgi:plastocyanin